LITPYRSSSSINRCSGAQPYRGSGYSALLRGCLRLHPVRQYPGGCRIHDGCITCASSFSEFLLQRPQSIDTLRFMN
jgi:hypothetical protein